jgi:acetolactate synthase-1/2/3 large subunit
MSRTAARLIVDQLLVHGVDHIFCVPGESYLAVLDALYDSPSIRLIVNRHESGSTFMADAYAKLTGRPGVAFVTRGPGATNGAIGVHTAFQDSTPMVLFVGQVGNDFVEREAFQEIDYRRMFGQMTKWVAQIDRADRIPEFVAHAFQVAASGRPGPVVLALPEDLLDQESEVEDAARYQPVQSAPTDEQVGEIRRLLGNARAPLVLLGGTGWTQSACGDLRAFAEANRLPVACAFRYQDLFDNRHPNYIGDVGIAINPQLARRVREADLILAIGPRLGEMTTGGYSLLSVPRPRQTLVHVHQGAEELGRVYQAHLMIASGMPQIAARLAAMAAVDSARWADGTRSARASYESWQDEAPVYAGRTPKLDLLDVVRQLQAALPADTIVTNGAGNFATWAHRYWRYGSLRTQLAPTAGSMGYGVPAGIAAKLVEPGRTVVTFAGDGDVLMTAQELATAVMYPAAVLILVFNNGMYGTIRMHQERHHPRRVIGTELVNPRFDLLASSYGAHGAVVERTEEFGPALAAAIDFIGRKNRPAVIELRIDPDEISPGATIDSIRSRAQAR